MFLASCSYTPLLKKEEFLLHKQTIKGNKHIAKDELSPLYQQLPNRRIAALGTKAYLYFYLIGRESFDTAKVNKEILQTQQKYELKLAKETDSLKKDAISKKLNNKLKKLYTKRTSGNYVMRVMGEPPSLYDTNLVSATKEQFMSYYFTRGYLSASVTYTSDTVGKNVSVVYNIEEEAPLRITNISYEIADSTIKNIYESDSLNSYLKEGMVYNESIFNQERERTFKLLRDHGYYFFTKNFIYIDVDTTGHKNEAHLFYVIRNPDEGKHKQFFIKDVVITIDKGKNYTSREYNYDNKKYLMHHRRYSRKILSSKIPIGKGTQYSATNTQKAQNRLSQLQMFKFVNITYQKENDSLIALINTSSLPRYQITDEFGVNTNVSRQIPGPYGSVTFSNRNTFRGCEMLDFSVSAGVEGQISIIDVNKFIRTTEINGNAGITFPQLLFPGGLKSYLDYNPRTRFSLSYVSSYRPDYDRTEVRGIMNYQLQTSMTSRLIIAPMEFNLINAAIKDSMFEKQLEGFMQAGSNIINNFRKSLVTNTSITYINNTNNPLINKKSHFLKVSAELGGLIPTIVASLSNESITQSNKLFGLPYYKFWKLGFDYRYYKPILLKSTLAMRISSNIVSTLNDNGNGIPYIKYLYAGGINSIRAWRTRRLGPGGYVVKNSDGTFSYKIEQPGEFNIESSIEGRFKIYKFFGIGIFADAGNVWTLKDEPNRPDGQFKLDRFYNQIALGTGIGLRLDFSFFVFRIDASVKTFDPAREPGDKFRLFKLTGRELLGENDQTVYSFGIGYPF